MGSFDSIPWVILAAVAGIFWFIRRYNPKYRSGRQRLAPNRATRPTAHSRPAPSGGMFAWPFVGDFDFEVVGESSYQQTLARNAGEHGREPADTRCKAQLILEDDNPYDARAVRVDVGGEVVGYLSRADARSFRRRLGQKGLAGQNTLCDAMIVGGGTRKNGERLHYGVRLDIKPFDT